ncbi:very short patch repair endonuclease [Virgibacillus sp. NKC19-3]|uniref:very short patch repair endonuclease n=1 Tax=Virgibacillus saliphilus TaxID=2831674 RepID=UPI001C9A7694|nr:very short patch repair endonuclease [Virgibacillus sp. NKC19-3]MBY7144576.1 very short patch repair endonuclease [Virgibacillus sp. NKC19-3]
MTDNLTKEQRRKNMKAIKSVSKLESIVSRELWNKGYRFRRNIKDLKGKPDISIKKYKTVIFIDSCFFHQCPLHGNLPSTNREFWERKLNSNVQRDREVNDYYNEKGWNLMRIWEHEVKEDLNKVIYNISEFIEKSK